MLWWFSDYVPTTYPNVDNFIRVFREKIQQFEDKN